MITTLNAETENATLNVDLKTDDGSECRNAETERNGDDGSEHRSLEVITTLNAETENATLNVDLKTDDGSERRN